MMSHLYDESIQVDSIYGYVRICDLKMVKKNKPSIKRSVS